VRFELKHDISATDAVLIVNFESSTSITDESSMPNTDLAGLALVILELMNRTLSFEQPPEILIEEVRKSNNLCMDDMSRWGTDLIDFLEYLVRGRDSPHKKITNTVSLWSEMPTETHTGLDCSTSRES
jgi:hypothetical protein